MQSDSATDDSNAAVDELIEEFGGDPRLAILALLHDLDVLARDFEASASRCLVHLDVTRRPSSVSPEPVEPHRQSPTK